MISICTIIPPWNYLVAIHDQALHISGQFRPFRSEMNPYATGGEILSHENEMIQNIAPHIAAVEENDCAHLK